MIVRTSAQCGGCSWLERPAPRWFGIRSGFPVVAVARSYIRFHSHWLALPCLCFKLIILQDRRIPVVGIPIHRVRNGWPTPARKNGRSCRRLSNRLYFGRGSGPNHRRPARARIRASGYRGDDPVLIRLRGPWGGSCSRCRCRGTTRREVFRGRLRLLQPHG